MRSRPATLHDAGNQAIKSATSWLRIVGNPNIGETVGAPGLASETWDSNAGYFVGCGFMPAHVHPRIFQPSACLCSTTVICPFSSIGVPLSL